LKQWANDGVNAIVLNLAEDTARRDLAVAVRAVRSARLDLYYWLEIARNPALADAHPEWMASLQGHSEWRRYHPAFPIPADNEVVKNYPWVPVVYKEAFRAHLQRVSKLLEGLPSSEGIFLNGLQAAPSACGCGNLLCRWTPDYGPVRTATRSTDDAAARFTRAIQELRPQAKVIPVWVTECDEEDGTQDGLCAGVGCFAGLCWKEYTRQLMPVAGHFKQLGVLAIYRALGKDLARYGAQAGWVKHALASFVEMPPRRDGTPVAVNRLIPVLQGFDVTLDEQQAQILRAREAGASGYVMALNRIDSSWEPRIVKVSAGK
jgi:hypothetical protein